MLGFTLTILYFILFGMIIYRWKWFDDDLISRHWLFSFFGIKVIMSVFLTAVYTNYYTDRSAADIYKYFDDSKVIFEALKSNPMDYVRMIIGLDFGDGYFEKEYYSKMLHWTRPYSNDLVSDSHIIIRMNAFLRIFSFGEIMVHNVFLNFLSFSGIYLLYLTFKSVVQGKEKLLFGAMMLLPSALFWGSGLLKEGILLFALAILVSAYFNLFIRFTLTGLLQLLIGLMLIVFTKFYLVTVLVIPLLGYFINTLFKLKPWIGYLSAFVVFLGVVNALPFVHSELDIVNQIAMKQQSFSNFIKAVPASSGFEINMLTDGYSIVKTIPNALLNTLLRPFPWEVSSPFVLLSMLENLLVLCCVCVVLLNRERISAQRMNLVLFNLTFVIGLFILIGLTTPVFGAIVRYKIPGLLFLFITLVMLLDGKFAKSKLKWI